ncbi:serine protease [Thalassococcus sp. S3]|uniref:serine protease n=1 Tax=Thalassococcus sp. S3 TaxID=2017482 RepID=UPI00102413C5|nr:serine protease [Thalassococcus sp. S3]QBF32718.1 peptidoglycan-binding protein [Thalassococcus sp. S3]
MRSLLAALAIAIWGLAQTVNAQQQDVVWVQIEAQPSLTAAQDRARVYAARLPDVNGFALGGGWYGIVLGPYLRSDAQRVLQVYRREGQIPRDSFIAQSAALRQQFWPVGANVLNRGVVTPPAPAIPDPEQPQAGIPPETPDQAPTADLQLIDETPTEARRSEARLTGQERRELQIALQWAGFYRSTIDGAFGRGTRSSMAAWQDANGYEVTGILTTLQRQALLDQYNAPLISVGMEVVRDTRAGIEVQIPKNEVAFDRYETPFAQYNASGDLGARVLLISQPGDQATLFGLYDIMQTLEIVPLDGPRERRNASFTLTGQNSKIISHTEAGLDDGEIKGFTLIWPVGDEERRTRVLAAMRDSFARLPGVLDPTLGADDVQSVDLVSGLQVRKPRISRSGFYIDRSGTVVTTSEAVESCGRITLDEEYEARLLTSDGGLGVAVLRPAEPLAPISIAEFSATPPRLQSDVAVSGYSFEGVLGAPTLTYGTLADVKGLRGETELKRLALAPLPGDAGGPVFDAGGSVMGMLLPKSQRERQLPGDVSFVAGARAIQNVLEDAGVRAQSAASQGQIAPQDLARKATGMTVLVSCWD